MHEVVTQSNILIVEDEQDIIDIIRFSLTRAGFAVRQATTGLEAFAEVAIQLPDLVIIDRMLPGMDGIEICRRLRNNAETSLLPIVMLTARSSDEDVIVGLEAGADDYLTKPFHPIVLAERLKAILRRTTRDDIVTDLAGIGNSPGKLITVCSYCKRIKDPNGCWHSMESFFSKWHELDFTHGICRDCHSNEVEPALNIPVMLHSGFTSKKGTEGARER